MSQSFPPPPTPPPTTDPASTNTTVDTLPHDIILTNILPRLDGAALASTSCASTKFRSLATQDHLWSNVCSSAWPSTNTARLRRVVSNFPPYGSRSFFSQSFPLLSNSTTPSENTNRPSRAPSSSSPPKELISAVDIHYRGHPVFSGIHETPDTFSDWFLHSPFIIDMIKPKQIVKTPMQDQYNEATCTEVSSNLTISWIVIDPAGNKAVNLSSYKPVLVQRHWLSKEVHMEFSSIVAVDHHRDKDSRMAFVLCVILIKLGKSNENGRWMDVREVSLKMEDMDGKHLNGKESLVALQRALEGKRGKMNSDREEGKTSHEEYLEKKKQRIKKRSMAEKRLDQLAWGILVGILIASFSYFVRMYMS